MQCEQLKEMYTEFLDITLLVLHSQCCLCGNHSVVSPAITALLVLQLQCCNHSNFSAAITVLLVRINTNSIARQHQQPVDAASTPL